MNTKTATNLPADPLRTKIAHLKQLLAAQPFVKGMKPEHMSSLSDCAMETQFEAGEVIFREGEIANRFYLILEGRVALETGGEECVPVQVQQIRAGEVLGWSWLFPPYTWHFNARAIEPTKAIFFYGTWLREQCQQDKRLGYELMNRVVAIVMERLQATRRELVHSLKPPAGWPKAPSHESGPGCEVCSVNGEFHD